MNTTPNPKAGTFNALEHEYDNGISTMAMEQLAQAVQAYRADDPATLEVLLDAVAWSQAVDQLGDALARFSEFERARQ